MATTVRKAITSAWQAVATAGDVTLTADEAPNGYPVLWAITDDTAGPTPVTPTITGGHVAKPGENVSMTLTGSERLWLSGAGAAFVTAVAPV